jgi:hypothetical protein
LIFAMEERALRLDWREPPDGCGTRAPRFGGAAIAPRG